MSFSRLNVFMMMILVVMSEKLYEKYSSQESPNLIQNLNSSDYSFFNLDMDQISLVTPMIITKNFISTTTEVIFYFKTEEEIIEDSKF
jgi:hypothetical protein